MRHGEYRMVMVRVIGDDENPVTGADVVRCELIGHDRKALEGTRVWIDKPALLTIDEVQERVLAKLGDTKR